jgi:hypothetical protein
LICACSAREEGKKIAGFPHIAGEAGCFLG